MKLHPLLVVFASLIPVSSVQDTPPAETAEKTSRVEAVSEELDCGTGGLEVDSNGFVYCSDFGSKLGPVSTGGTRVWRLDPMTGKAEVFADGLRGASGNALGPDGSFYQSNIGSSTITRIAPDGESSVFLAENLRQPVGIVVDAQGTLCG